MKQKKEQYIAIFTYSIFALFYLWLASRVPYTHDDWDWGLSNGISQLLTASINSRYAGNFFVVVMTRSKVLKTFIMASVCFLIPVGIASIAARNIKEHRQSHQLFYFLLSNFLILSMAPEVWRQTYGWVSGFANYVISGAFMLLHLSVLLRVFDSNLPTEKTSIGKDILLGCTCFVGQLFLENLSIFLVLLILFVCFLYFRRFHRIPRSTLLMAVGAVLGLIVIFSSDIYSSLWHTGSAVDGLRQLSLRADTSFFDNLMNLLLQIAHLLVNGAEDQPFISSIVLCLLAYSLVREKDISKKMKAVIIAVNLSIIVYYAVVNILNVSYSKSGMLVALLGVAVNFLYLCVTTVEAFFVFRSNKWEMYKAGTIWLSAIAYLAPLVLTTESGPRLFFIFNIFVIILICLLIQHIGFSVEKKKFASLIILLAAGTTILLLHYGNVYYAIGSCNEQRLEIIEQSVAADQKEIILPKYPYEKYLWLADPQNDKRIAFYKEFYGIPDDVQIIFE